MSRKLRYFCIFLIVLIAISLCVCLLFRGQSEIASFRRFSQTKNLMDIESFQFEVAKYTIVQTEVYYVPFHVRVNTPLTEDELLATIPHVKVIGSRLASYPREISSFFSKCQLIKAQDVPCDFRYSCLMYSKSEVIRFSISHMGINVLYINGHPYEAPFEIIEAFLKLLPTIDYELAMKEIRDNKDLPTNIDQTQ